MSNEPRKIMPVRFVAAPSQSSSRIKTMTTNVAHADYMGIVVNAIEDSCATSVINTLLDSSNG
jgi:hypothetical protein